MRILENECEMRIGIELKKFKITDKSIIDENYKSCNYDSNSILKSVKKVFQENRINIPHPDSLIFLIGSDFDSQMRKEIVAKNIIEGGMKLLPNPGTYNTDFWIMVKSDIHIGNVASSMDRAIYSLRELKSFTYPSLLREEKQDPFKPLWMVYCY